MRSNSRDDVVSKWEWWRRPKSLDKSLTSLTFTDVIFGLVFTEIFTRAAALHVLSTAVVVHLALSLTVAVGSYIGYRGSLKRGTFRLAFFNLPLLRFMLDLFMIFLYYVLAVTPDETKNPAALVDARTDSLVVLLIFAAYLAWDLVSWVMSKRGYEIRFQGNRTAVTLLGFLATGAVFGVTWTANSSLSQRQAIVVDSLLIAIVILYRWAKDCIQPGGASLGQVEPAVAPDVKGPAIRADVDAIRDAVARLDKIIAGEPGEP
jgi:hypothetical protein